MSAVQGLCSLAEILQANNDVQFSGKAKDLSFHSHHESQNTSNTAPSTRSHQLIISFILRQSIGQHRSSLQSWDANPTYPAIRIHTQDPTATMPPTPPSKPSTHPESKLTRALRALPLLLILPIADLTFGRSLRQLEPLISTTENVTSLDLGSGIVVPFCTSYFGLKGLDEVIGMFTAFFTSCIGGYDRVGRLQAIAFLADLVPMQVIWMVEGSRPSSSGTITSKL
jgi:hypothetical protein